MPTTIAIGCDHAGFELKEFLKNKLVSMGYSLQDFGTDSPDSVDYPDFVHPLAEAIEKKLFDFGILICGSANGVAMTANKHRQVRAAIAWNNEIASLARLHNDANILCLPARFISPEEALEFCTTFITTSFEGGRHQKRVNKIAGH